jgi:hypothetical protein
VIKEKVIKEETLTPVGDELECRMIAEDVLGYTGEKYYSGY